MNRDEWQAILTNDKTYDGKFYCACRTTHVVCRPSCTAKKCKPENVVIYYSLPEAIREGYRPCQKCRPEIEDWKGTKYELAAAAAKLIEDSCLEKFSLDRVAEELFVNKNYLSRVFKQVRGQTMLNYHHLCRCEYSKRFLEKKEYSIDLIANKTGYMTASHYVKTFHKIFGITPLQYRRDFYANTDRQ